MRALRLAAQLCWPRARRRAAPPAAVTPTCQGSGHHRRHQRRRRWRHRRRDVSPRCAGDDGISAGRQRPRLRQHWLRRPRRRPRRRPAVRRHRPAGDDRPALLAATSSAAAAATTSSPAAGTTAGESHRLPDTPYRRASGVDGRPVAADPASPAARVRHDPARRGWGHGLDRRHHHRPADRDHLDARDGDDTVTAGERRRRASSPSAGGGQAGDDPPAAARGATSSAATPGATTSAADRGNDFVEAYGDRPHHGAPATTGADLGRPDHHPGAGARAATAAPARDVVALYGDRARGQLAARPLHGRPAHRAPPRPTSGRAGDGHDRQLRGVPPHRRRCAGGSTARPRRDRVWTITGGELRAWTYGGDDWVQRIRPRRHDQRAASAPTRSWAARATTSARHAERGSC